MFDELLYPELDALVELLWRAALDTTLSLGPASETTQEVRSIWREANTELLKRTR